jgi:hypothetical protein
VVPGGMRKKQIELAGVAELPEFLYVDDDGNFFDPDGNPFDIEALTKHPRYKAPEEWTPEEVMATYGEQLGWNAAPKTIWAAPLDLRARAIEVAGRQHPRKRQERGSVGASAGGGDPPPGDDEPSERVALPPLVAA